MDVELLSKRKHVCFEDIPVGECFMYCGVVYIKIRKDDTLYSNSFNVDTNDVMTVYKDTKVRPLYMKLVEKER